MTTAAPEVVRRLLDLFAEAVASGDTEATAFVDMWDDGATVAQLRPPGSDAEIAGTNPYYRGSLGIRSGVGDVIAAWSELRFDIDQLLEMGDRVLALTTAVGEDREGNRLELGVGFLVTVRDGKVSAVEVHLDREAAIAAANLPALRPTGEWARLGNRLQVPATVLGPAGDGAVILEIVEGWERKVPLPDGLADGVPPGTEALVFFHDDGRLAGWYIPDAQVGVDMRTEEI